MMITAMNPAAAGVRLKRVGAAFFDQAAADNRMARLCESSGSEHSSHQSPGNNDFDDYDLSALVTSFIERDYSFQDAPLPDDDASGEQDSSSCNHNHSHSRANNAVTEAEQDSKLQKSSSERYRWSHYSESRDMLQSLLLDNNNDGDNKDDVKQMIRAATELACQEMGEMLSSSSSLGQGSFKRALMSRLRDMGFDAGLCKSRWEKCGRHPAGHYEYVDVKFGSNRYIVEAFLTGEFLIARPTPSYAALLEVFPRVFFGKAEELKQIVKLMSVAIKESLKSAEMHVPPWRRNGYMQAKWFGPYKRTINPVTLSRSKASDQQSHSNDEAFSAKLRSFGFKASASATVSSHHFRDDFPNKLVGLKVGYLTAAFNGSGGA